MHDVVQGKRIEIRLSPEQVAAVDAWRRHEEDIPPRAVAIVRLMRKGLAATKKKPKIEPKRPQK